MVVLFAGFYNLLVHTHIMASSGSKTRVRKLCTAMEGQCFWNEQFD